jgi:hypothetical protein
MGISDGAYLILAWSYVAFRIAHSLVHLTINKVPPRFLFYFLSNLVLLALWLKLVHVW